MLLQHLATLQAMLVNEYSQSRGMFMELAHIEALLAETYRDRIQYELLQNSDDAGATDVDVTIRPDGSVAWVNNGRPFNADDVEALCRSASSSKTRGDSIGYRGIGFKSLAAVASRIEVRSGGVSFSFDRAEAFSLLSHGVVKPNLSDIPLIRIPSAVTSSDTAQGAMFLVTPLSASESIVGEIDPLALLFLRHIKSLTVTNGEVSHTYLVDRQRDRIRVTANGKQADFAIIEGAHSSVALPLDDSALSMCTLRGRLACFLPLDDPLGIPLVVSGDILTDPSRTHAVVADDTTQACLEESACAFAAQLADPNKPWFQRAWELLTMAEDPRSILSSGSNSADYSLLVHLRRHLKTADLTFSVSPIRIQESDLPKIFPLGAPTALYRPDHLPTARALRAAFGLPAMDVARQVRSASRELSGETIDAARQHIQGLVKASGRQPNDDEKYLLGTEPPLIADSQPLPSTSPTGPGTEFPEVVEKWRTAELAVAEWLNLRGWNVSDVSKQNLGYDLVGISPDGDRTMIEIKRVQRPDAQFSMTNNEMGAVQSEAGRYLLGIVIGEGRYSRLMLLDPTDNSVPRERVCRAWEWRFIDWSRYGTYVS